MSISYKCKRCDCLETGHYSDLKKHLNRKKYCSKKGEMIFMSDDQLIIFSLIPYYNNIHSIKNDELEHMKDSNIIDKNKNELFRELDNIEKNKLKICKYCNIEFTLINDLKKHLLINCFYNELIKRDNETKKENNNIDAINNINISQCQTVNNTNNTTNNNINIVLEIKNPIPFDNNWDISKINEGIKRDITFSNVMYTSLLEEILKNEINLNVVIDKDKDSGMVYKNDIDKYIQMKSKDIVVNTMEKLNFQLNEINKNNNISFKEIIDFSRQMINKKYNDYKKNQNIQENVGNIICDIFGNKKTEAIDIAKKVMESSNINKSGY